MLQRACPLMAVGVSAEGETEGMEPESEWRLEKEPQQEADQAVSTTPAQ